MDGSRETKATLGPGTRSLFGATPLRPEQPELLRGSERGQGRVHSPVEEGQADAARRLQMRGLREDLPQEAEGRAEDGAGCRPYRSGHRPGDGLSNARRVCRAALRAGERAAGPLQCRQDVVSQNQNQGGKSNPRSSPQGEEGL